MKKRVYTKEKTKAKPPAKRTASTALARIRKDARATDDAIRTAILPAPVADRTLTTEAPSLGQIGLVEVKLTDHEETVFSEAVNPDDVMIKPTKDGQVYIPHFRYTKQLNRAFGRLGWALVPLTAPKKSEKGVIVLYMLYIHGQPARMAWGEQDFHDGNKEQSYGDAVESTVAYGLRRTTKQMGLWGELWDKDWSERFLREFGVKVKLKPYLEGDKPRYVWRRKDAQKFWNEESGSADYAETRQRKEEKRSPPPPPRADKGKTITVGTAQEPGQWYRLWSIIRRVKRADSEVQQFLKARYGIEDSKTILAKDYDAIVAAIEAKGPLLAEPVRELELVKDSDINWNMPSR